MNACVAGQALLRRGEKSFFLSLFLSFLPSLFFSPFPPSPAMPSITVLTNKCRSFAPLGFFFPRQFQHFREQMILYGCFWLPSELPGTLVEETLFFLSKAKKWWLSTVLTLSSCEQCNGISYGAHFLSHHGRKALISFLSPH